VQLVVAAAAVVDAAVAVALAVAVVFSAPPQAAAASAAEITRIKNPAVRHHCVVTRDITPALNLEDSTQLIPSATARFCMLSNEH
jgi:hypothetical protein